MAEKSSFEWRGDNRVLLTLKKADGPSYWKYLLKDVSMEAKELQIWWEMRDKHIEELEEYMMADNIEERSKAKDDL